MSWPAHPRAAPKTSFWNACWRWRWRLRAGGGHSAQQRIPEPKPGGEGHPTPPCRVQSSAPAPDQPDDRAEHRRIQARHHPILDGTGRPIRQERPGAQIGWYGGYYKLERFAACDFHIALTEDIARNIVTQGPRPNVSGSSAPSPNSRPGRKPTAPRLARQRMLLSSSHSRGFIGKRASTFS